MSGLDPEFGIKMMEITVAEMNATLILHTEMNAHKNEHDLNKCNSC